jgi:Arc/MetJ-type ribon-helix-helix transcriptional regulator
MAPESATRAGRRLFGSWLAALHAAGVQGVRREWPVWSKESIVEAICERAGSGKRLNTPEVVRSALSLYQASRTHFGGWSEALIAAGFDPKRLLRHYPRWTSERLLDDLRARMDAGADVSRPSHFPQSLRRVCRRVFGSWPKALEAARGD